MNDLPVVSSIGITSSRKAKKILKLSHSSIRRILYRILHRYPYKLQSLHVSQPEDSDMRFLFSRVKYAGN